MQIAFPFKYLNNFWRALKIPLLVNCVISDILGARTFAIADTKRYVPIIKSSTQDNTEKLQQLKSGIKWTINSNKHQCRSSTQTQNHFLHYLIDPNFQGIQRILVLFRQTFVFLKTYWRCVESVLKTCWRHLSFKFFVFQDVFKRCS